MILDPRIKEGKRPLTCLEVEQAREFVGKECIFSDRYENFKDLNQYLFVDSAILSIDERASCGDYVFRNTKNNFRYRLILPCEWIEQPDTPEFVPYTLDTWQHEFNPGDVITFRGKIGTNRDGSQYKCMYAGWRQDSAPDAIIILGLWGFTFKELFELYEIHRGDGPRDWEPFGRKVETIDLNAI